MTDNLADNAGQPTANQKKRYTGSCHCGAIRFEIETELTTMTECNCSMCSRKGILHHRVAPEQFQLLSGADSLATYQFGTCVAKHHFCKACGIHTFTRPRAAPHLYTINLRTLDDINLASLNLNVIYFNGQDWENSVASLQQQHEHQ